MTDQSKIFQNFQSSNLDLQTPWVWLKDLIWAVSMGRGFDPDYWKTSRINAVAVDAVGGVGATALAVTQMKPKVTAQVNAELDWFCQLIDAKSFAEACSWMSMRKQVIINVPETQYKYGIPSRSTARIAGKVAIPEDNASFVNYLVDAYKFGEIHNVQLKMDSDLSNTQSSVQYLSF